jgi:hypothetical protein
MLGATLLAGALDLNAVHYRYLRTGQLIPCDLSAFRQNAAWATGRGDAAAAGLPYPPPFLLLSVPMSWPSPAAETVLWSLAGAAMTATGARAAGIRWRAIGLGLLSPPTLYCFTMGQSGLFVSGFLLAGFGLAETSPLLAGIAAGCVIIKPQFGLLLPICYLASRNWRAMAAAAATVTFLCVLSAGVFGLQVWRQFLVHNTGNALQLLNHSWPIAYQFLMVTVFMVMRSLGGGFAIAYAAQGVASIVAGWTTWYLWRAGAAATPERLVGMMCLTVLASPYAYTYDLPGVATAIAGCAAASAWRRPVPATMFYMLSSLYVVLSIVWFLTGALVLLAMVLAHLPRERLSTSVFLSRGITSSSSGRNAKSLGLAWGEARCRERGAVARKMPTDKDTPHGSVYETD